MAIRQKGASQPRPPTRGKLILKSLIRSLSSFHKRTSQRILCYGNSFPSTFPEVLLAHASLDDWPIVAKHANMTSSRGSINAMPATITSESSTSPVEFNMATVCTICAGPIEPPDQHYHCVACLGLTHAEAVLDESECGHCTDLPARMLRARRDMVRGLFGVRPTSASMPLVGPPSPGDGSDHFCSTAKQHRSLIKTHIKECSCSRIYTNKICSIIMKLGLGGATRVATP